MEGALQRRARGTCEVCRVLCCRTHGVCRCMLMRIVQEFESRERSIFFGQLGSFGIYCLRSSLLLSLSLSLDSRVGTGFAA